jgi:hypothetical protein
VELDEGPADLDAGGAVRREAVAHVVARGRLGSGRPERDVVEVVLDVGRRLDEGEGDALGDLEDLRRAVGKLGTGGREVGDPQADMLERTLLTRAFGVEERQLATAGVASDQREVVLAGDHVHPQMPFEEGGDRIAVGDPERDVVECLRLHPTTVATTPGLPAR